MVAFARPFGEVTEMTEHSRFLGLAALVAAAVVLPAQAHAEHEGRYFGFGYQPFAAPYPPVVYPPPPRVRETSPGVYEYEVAPGRWVRMRSGYGYEPPRGSVRIPPPSQVARPEPAQPPVPQSKPDADDEPSVAVRDAPATVTLEPVREEPLRQEPLSEEPMQEQAAPQPAPQAPEQTAARTPDETDETDEAAGDGLSCEAAADIVETFGFSDVQSTSCSGDVYGFDASRDGSSYSISVSAADGELTEVRRR